jgi:hypothetical protein
VAGALAIGSTQPLDIVRVRMQQVGQATGNSLTKPQSKNVFSCLAGIVRKEGPLALYKGMLFPLTFASIQVTCALCSKTLQ